MRPHHNPDPHVQGYHYHVALGGIERLTERNGRAPSVEQLTDHLWSFWGPAVFHTREYARASARAAVTGQRRVRRARRRR